jgi:YHS domain-containing protein
MAMDVVCGMEVDEGTAPAKTDYEGRTYFFCSNSCKQDFLENPDRYLEGEEEMWREVA